MNKFNIGDTIYYISRNVILTTEIESIELNEFNGKRILYNDTVYQDETFKTLEDAKKELYKLIDDNIKQLEEKENECR